MSTFVSLSSTDLRVEISPIGAALARVFWRDHPVSLVLGLPTPEDYADAPHAIGVIVGPIAGRISQARAPLGQHVFEMEANAPPHALHSGSQGLQHQSWSIAQQSEAHVCLTVDLPDGACGLPGHRHFEATYRVDGAELTLDIAATSDQDTLINATSHAYWTLDGSGHLEDHLLSLPCSDRLETDAALCPTGRRLPGQDGPFDFSTPRSPVFGPPLDATFTMHMSRLTTPEHRATLASRKTGLTLDVASTEPGLVLYAGEHLPRLAATANAPPIHPFSALAIETQGWPDAPNHPHFPSILVKSGVTNRQITRFSLRQP